jgi:hypothetical protein
MAITQFVDKENTNIGFQPIQQPPSDFGEVASKSFRSFRDNYISTSRQRLIQEQQDKRDALFEDISGERLEPSMAKNFKPFEETRISIRSGLDPQDVAILKQRHDERFKEEAINEAKQREPEKYKDILSHNQVVEEARKRANASRQEFEAASTRTSSFDRIVGSLVGGLGATATDPINIASLPFGAARGASVLRTVLTEAGVNAGAELATQPFVANWQREVGQDYGFNEVVENVGFAALFGGSFAAVTKGAKPAASIIYNKLSTLPNLSESAKLASTYMSRVAHIKENIPFIRSKRTAQVKQHTDSVEAASRAIDKGQRVDSADLKITENEFLNIDTSVKKGDTEVIKNQLDEIKRYIEQPSEGKIPNKEPEYTLETLPQQLLDKAQKKEGDLTVKDFDDVEVRILESAGVKPNNKGIINKDTLVNQREQRLKDDAIEDLTGKERDHIVSHLNTARVKSLEDQNIEQQVENILKGRETQESLPGEDVVEPDFMDRVLERSESPETLRAEEINFRALAEEKPDLLVSLEDGDTTLGKLLEEFDKDENFVAQITSCAIGG